MGKILKTPEEKLRELDCMWHAHGMSEWACAVVGKWMAAVGLNFQMQYLDSAQIARIHHMHRQITKKQRSEARHV
ncbi:MAG: hypothetical protein JO253_03055 [Alphaproteobacteria bacterium]|nr:hypothetical protein [Alphaproteobacteria bacterium]